MPKLNIKKKKELKILVVSATNTVVIPALDPVTLTHNVSGKMAYAGTFSLAYQEDLIKSLGVYLLLT